MPPRDVLGLLRDVIDAAEFMKSRADGISIDEYLRNADLQVIFERKFEIIGEALNQLAKRRFELFSEIRHAQDAVDFRNIIIHAYAAVDHEIVWQVFESTLNELLEDVVRLLERLKPSAQ